MYTFLLYFLLFIIYSFIGWIMEVLVFLFQERKFINRGFLIGPYCPIYGFCSVFMILTFHKYIDSPFVLFVMASLLCTFIEYITSFIMEKLFNTRWWDYSNVPFNINGRVCLHNSVIFGILGCLLVYYVNPFIESLLRNIPADLLMGISIALISIFIADNITSFNIISRVKSTANTILKDSTEEITEKVKEILSTKSFFNRRLLDAFPDLKSIIKEKINNKKN